jgi:alpha-amylase
MVKYAEANRLHKKMMALTALCRTAGDPPEARRAIGRAQCNDAYWHGVFGGLYLPHLRDGVWYQLARAEALLRSGEGAAWELRDIDADGQDELWIHDATFSAIVSPARGGVIEEYTVFTHGINYANTLTRRREPYHDAAAQGGHGEASEGERTVGVRPGTDLPPLDLEPRALIRERALAPEVDEEMYARADYDPAWSVSSAHLTMDVGYTAQGVLVTFRSALAGVPVFEKRYHFLTGGGLDVEYRWNGAVMGGAACFAPEVSYSGPMEITATPGAPVWDYEIVTVAKSEKALEQTVQGRSVTPRWPIAAGEARLQLRTAGRA